MGDQLSTVAHILSTNPFYLRSKQIRQVDKALITLENFMNPDFIKRVRAWKESYDGLQILKNKLDAIDKTQSKIVDLEQEIEDLKVFTRPWYILEENERDLIIQQAKRTHEFLKNQGNITEASVIDRYNRSVELSHLFMYADRVPHLCDAILHYHQKKLYSQNLIKITEKIEKIQAQIKTIKRGFWVAFGLCALIATIPISLPFSITLWQRKRRLIEHLHAYEDLQLREQKRFLLAEEGAIVTEEIQNVVGEVSYDTMKNLLIEVKDLKTEFHDTNRFLSMCATILNYIDTSKDTLIPLFGPLPELPRDRFDWLIQNVEKYENAHKKLESVQDMRHDLYLRKKQTTKGYEREILINSIEQLETSMSNMLILPLDLHNKIIFADMCLVLPEICKKIRETIFYITKNYDVDLNAWHMGHVKIHEYAHSIALMVLDAEIAARLAENTAQSNLNSTTSPEIPHPINAVHLNEGL